MQSVKFLFISYVAICYFFNIKLATKKGLLKSSINKDNVKVEKNISDIFY